MIRSILIALGCSVTLVAFAMTDPKPVDIPPGNLIPALEALAKRAAVKIVYQPDQLRSFRTKGVKGVYELKDVVRTLLRGTPLELRIDRSGALIIADPNPESTERSACQESDGNSPVKGHSKSSSKYELAEADQGPSAEVTSPAGSAETDQNGPNPEEVVITARKRTETLQDVPIAVSVVSASTMLQNNALSLQDYYASVPGLSLTDFGSNGKVSIALRGLSTGTTGNPTVGITVDDVPVGVTNTALINGTGYVPEFDPADLQRIEFLKGPQGTLYGANSLGGTVRYVTALPDMNSASGRIEVDGSGIPGSGGGYGVRSAGNFPLISDALAVRASLFDRHDPAWVDDPSQGKTNVNGIDVYGGHLDGLYRIAENFNVRLSAMIQRQEGDGDGTTDTDAAYRPVTGYYDQSRLPGTGNYTNEYQLYAATLNFTSPLVDVTTISAYSAFYDNENDDVTGSFGEYAQQIFGVAGSYVNNLFNSSKFSEEVRVSSRDSKMLDWQLGGFYTAENNGPNQGRFFANELGTGSTVGLLLDYPFHAHYNEYAGFGDLTYHFTDQFNLQVGARESHDWQDYYQDVTGPIEGPPFQLDSASRDNSFTYLVTPQLRVSDSLMTYARIASGYMPGGPNTPSAPDSGVPSIFGPSKTNNFEVGVKSQLMDRRVSIDADIFYIDWSKIQLTGFSSTGFTYVFNGGKAKSEGVEFSGTLRPVEGITLSASAAYIDAVLTDNAGQGFPGVSGNWLPFSSRYSASSAAEYRFHRTTDMEGFVGASLAYVGKRYEGFPAALGLAQPLVPSYTYGDVHAGLSEDSFTVTAFVKNVANERGILSTQQQFAPATTGPLHTAFITPRTIGLSIVKEF